MIVLLAYACKCHGKHVRQHNRHQSKNYAGAIGRPVRTCTQFQRGAFHATNLCDAQRDLTVLENMVKIYSNTDTSFYGKSCKVFSKISIGDFWKWVYQYIYFTGKIKVNKYFQKFYPF